MSDRISTESQISAVENANGRMDAIDRERDSIERVLDTLKRRMRRIEEGIAAKRKTAELLLTLAHGRLQQELEKKVASVTSSDVPQASKGMIDAMREVTTTPLSDPEEYTKKIAVMVNEARKSLKHAAERIMSIQEDKDREIKVDEYISSFKTSASTSQSSGMLFWESFVSQFPLDDPMRHKMEKELPPAVQKRAMETRSRTYGHIAATLMSHVGSSASTTRSEGRGATDGGST